MKKAIITILAILAVVATGSAAFADNYSGNDYDIIMRRNNGNPTRKYSADEIHNVTQNYRILPDSTNFELYNYIKDELNPSGYTIRKWQPKYEVSVINDANDYSVEDGNKVYNFNSFAYQIPQTTDFVSLTFIGQFELKDGTIYRYWK